MLRKTQNQIEEGEFKIKWRKMIKIFRLKKFIAKHWSLKFLIKTIFFSSRIFFFTKHVYNWSVSSTLLKCIHWPHVLWYKTLDQLVIKIMISFWKKKSFFAHWLVKHCTWLPIKQNPDWAHIDGHMGEFYLNYPCFEIDQLNLTIQNPWSRI